MTSRNTLAIALTVVSIGLLIPGLTQPALTIVASINVLGSTQEIFRQTQSVLVAVRRLHESDNDFVAGLILFFSVTVPFLKALALVIMLSLRNPVARYPDVPLSSAHSANGRWRTCSRWACSSRCSRPRRRTTSMGYRGAVSTSLRRIAWCRTLLFSCCRFPSLTP
jgi:hypothetical protein